ncbi:MAG: helix-turn-helix domain-containing protein, partial [Saprospiraceae bacterium]|nr:helix-turn-helix domain-containing protein [Saprospiraceae bacterium]
HAGNGWCRVVQYPENDPRSSHIPILLLTARGDVESRITGLRQGADAYLVKPFHPEELLVILNNLIQLRDKLQARYKATAIGERVAAGSLSVEEVFLQKLRATVAAELSNPELTPQEICRKMGMGHTNLNLKINALTGMPISLFIRKMRLHRAMELLGASELSISEIAYETGFNDPKYFSRVFAEEYGGPPSSFRKS